MRPSVTVSNENLAAALRRHLATQLPRLAAIPGIVGITLNGGLSRGYADHLSEIDVTLYLDAATYRTWQEERSPVALGIVVLDGQLYDIKAVDIEQARTRTWESDERWDASYAEILYDPAGAVATLYANQLAPPPAATDASGYMMSAWWYYRLAGDSWLHREDMIQGHAMLNQAATAVVKALFCANEEFIPHEKWLFHMSRTLAWTPREWFTRLAGLLCTGDLSRDSLIARQATIDQVWHEIDAYLVEHFFAGLPVHVMQRPVYLGLEHLAERGAVTLDEWQALGFGAVPNYEPFHSVVRVADRIMTLDKEALMNLPPDALYPWHFAVADAVRSQR